MKPILLFILSVLIISCSNNPKGGILSNLLPTKNEDSAINEISKYYGGTCSCAFGKSISTANGKKNYVELEVKQSEVLETYKNNADLPCSNIAYLFYAKLVDEKTKYDEIRTVISYNDGTSTTCSYPLSQLEIVKAKMLLVNKVFGFINEKKFDSLRSMLNDTSFAKYKKDLIDSIIKTEDVKGPVKKVIPFGFAFGKISSGKEVLHISVAIFREKQRDQFSVDFDPNIASNNIISMNYKF